MAEAVKVALIRDAAFFAWLERHADDAAPRSSRRRIARLDPRAAPSCTCEHIAHGGDPFEIGSARPLDFGHWAAHKLESADQHRAPPRRGGRDRHRARHPLLGRWRACSRRARSAGRARLLEQLGFRLWHDALDPPTATAARVLAGLREFREHLGGELTVTLLAARPRRRGPRDRRGRWCARPSAGFRSATAAP